MEIKKEVSAGGIIYRMENGVPKFLLLNKANQGWGIPKGRVEGEETIEQTAVREISEESGLPEDRLRIVKKLGSFDFDHFRGPDEYRNNMTVFLVEDLSNGKINPQSAEAFTEGKYFELDEAFELLAFADIRPYLMNAFDYLKSQK